MIVYESYNNDGSYMMDIIKITTYSNVVIEVTSTFITVDD